ncbi:RIP metalloprotease RseP [Paenibacillus methanolicus]|uniref:Zinc metalloprotease n=1 Tax=Paenibacillus methanolicus TaxID=582686 RepID=A0A5S5CE44_9BACL|nr:RIP metalloprotease RseP [Paenibacillus methanolicus]TYP77617.1 regulator of sigma E protease [Paenibacillus methanolicus]
MHMIQVVFLTVLVFFVIVTIHEWGHYYFAKRAGILVREFAIGFGPKLFSIKRGETRYTLRLVPAGGFVRMAGEDPELVEIQPGQTVAVRIAADSVTRFYLDRLDERTNVIRGEIETIDLEDRLKVTLNADGVSEVYNVHPQALLIAKGRETQIAPRDRQFGSKSVGARSLAIVAGPVMNFILAFVLFFAFFQMAGVPLDTPKHLFIGEIVAGKPADKSGLTTGDIIVAINGETIGTDQDKMIALISKSPNKPITFTVTRDDKKLDIKMTPEPDPETGEGKVGIRAASFFETRPAGFIESFSLAGQDMKNWTIMIFDGFKKLILGQFKMDDLGGPVRTAQVTGQIAQQGIEQLTKWTAVLSLYLGIFNLLPIPALDGSRLMFLGLEAVRRRPIDPNRESMVHFIGFALLMLLMVAVTYNDILRLVRVKE